MTCAQPLVSVCIPAYNSEKYLAETVVCLLSQQDVNLEVVIVDDGSTDNTATVVLGFEDKRVKYERQPNKGAAAARNRAFELSSGDFIKFMDADDLLTAGSLHAQLSRIAGHPGCIASSRWGRFFEDNIETFAYNPEPVWKDLNGADWVVESLIDSGYNMVQPGIFLIPRKLIEDVGGWNESLNLIDDFEFMTRVIVNSKMVFFCEDATLMYRSGIQGSLSKLHSRKHMESAFLSQTLATRAILQVRDDASSRLACANASQVWAYAFYPAHLDLYTKIQADIDRLGGSNSKRFISRSLELLSRLIGWKRAKRLKIFLLSIMGRSHFKRQAVT
jgi:glycosyltransferase involved in cell wall biosynthesis